MQKLRPLVRCGRWVQHSVLRQAHPRSGGKELPQCGRHETAKRKLKEASAKEYARTYNRLKARKQRGAISADEWNQTVAVAEELRAAFQKGELSESEYCRKLKAL